MKLERRLIAWVFAIPLIYLFDVLIWFAGQSEMSWSEIRRKTKEAIRDAFKKKPPQRKGVMG